MKNEKTDTTKSEPSDIKTIKNNDKVKPEKVENNKLTKKEPVTAPSEHT